jgi:hypothetical protein
VGRSGKCRDQTMAVCEHRTMARRATVLPRAALLLVGLLLAATSLVACAGGSIMSGSGTTTSTTRILVPRPLPASSTTATTTITTNPTIGTRQFTFDPYGTDGKIVPTLTVTHTLSGTCVTPGVAGTSSFRCFAQPGSTVYDPCFAPSHATSGPLACVSDPATPVAVAFELGTLPTEPAGGPAHRIWAMRLSNGQASVLVNAAWGGLGPFACPSPGSGKPEADCHSPQPGSPWWRTACQLGESKNFPFTPFRVEIVWR